MILMYGLIITSSRSYPAIQFYQYALIESKKMYVRYISHELRTPLNSAFLGELYAEIDYMSLHGINCFIS